MYSVTHGRPVPSKRNTMQRMLDLEKSKVVQNQLSATALNPFVQAHTAPRRNSNVSTDRFILPLKSTGQAMVAPSLSLSTPVLSLSEKSSSNRSNRRRTNAASLAADVFTPEEDEDGSDVSSICRSPGWDDYDGRKRRKQKLDTKERRRWEKEKAGTELKSTQQLKSRLSKPPPAHKRFSEMPISTDQAVPIPEARTSSEIADRRDGHTKAESRSRRGSLEMGLRSLIQATNALPTLWKSTPATPSQDPEESINNGGFLGGLKLKLATEARIQREIQTQASIDDNDERDSAQINGGATQNESRGTNGNNYHWISNARSLQLGGSGIQGSGAVSMGHSEDPNCVQASYEAGIGEESQTSRPISVAFTTIMDRNIRRGQNSSTSVAEYLYPDSKPLPPLRSSSKDVVVAESPMGPELLHTRGILDEPDEKRSSSPTAIVHEGPFHGNRDGLAETPQTTEPRNGHGERGYVQIHRQQSLNRAVKAFQDETLMTAVTSIISTRSHGSRGRSLSSRRNCTSNSCDEGVQVASPPTRERLVKENGAKAGDEYHAFLTNDYTPPELQLYARQPVDSSKKEAIIHHRKASWSAPITPTFKGIKTAAKAAFHRNILTSSSGMARHSMGEWSQSLGRGLIDYDQHRPVASLNKSDRVLGEHVSSLEIRDFTRSQPRSSSTAAQYRLPNREVMSQSTVDQSSEDPSIRSTLSAQSRPQNLHSKSVTTSSNNSTLCESPNTTTPTASRPQSRKGWTPTAGERNANPIQAEFTHNRVLDHNPPQNESAVSVQSGPVMNDDAADSNSGHESWSRTALPLESNDEEDGAKTPTDKNTVLGSEVSDYSMARKPPRVKTADLSSPSNQSLSNSRSQPQGSRDLSFLPPLKHQSLPRRLKDTGKGIPSRNTKRASTKPDVKQQAVNPQTNTPPLSTSSGDSSSVSPTGSGQYLRDARMKMPRAPAVLRPPKKTQFPNSHIPAIGLSPGVEPIAKMFVVCCSCQYFQDMPSKIYECMAKPENVVKDINLGVSGVISTAVKCPWCSHGMSTSCCSGYAAVVYLREKLH